MKWCSPNKTFTCGCCFLDVSNFLLFTIPFQTLGECEEWMRHFHSALRQECPTLVPRTFPNIPLDDAHNVQSHATDMRVLDVARERLRKAEAQRQLEREIMAAQAEEAAARDRLSPEISTTGENLRGIYIRL